jgi:YggT family protein
MPYIANAIAFLIGTSLDVLIGIFLIRTTLIAVNAPFYDPLCQFIYKVTNPVLAPIRRVLPRKGKIDGAAIGVAFVLAFIELALLGALAGTFPRLPGWLLGAVVAVLNIAVWMAFWALLIRAALSFFTNERSHPNTRLLVQLTEPIVRPFRRFVPAVGGLDFSFWFASIALILVRLLVIAPLADLAARL